MSLRLRVVALIGMVLLVSMLLGTLAAGYQAKRALNAELNAGLLGARQTVDSAFEDLPNSDHPARDLRQLISTFNGNRHVRAALLQIDGRPVQTSHTQSSPFGAPRWFHALLGSSPPDVEIRVPGDVAGFRAVRLTPSPGLDVGATWAEFSGVLLVLTGSAAVGLALVYVVIGAAFRPLRSLSTEFGRIGAGDYSGRVAEEGPLELLSLQRGFNEMAAQLAAATDRNRTLTDQLVSIQDEERADIARELHDEIGPHLFGVNIDAEMIADLNAAGRYDTIPDQVRSIQTAVGHMQRQVRGLLDRLRPARVTEFGLNVAVRELAAVWSARRREIVFDLDLADEALIPEAVKETVYRVIQEAANNAIRHGDPKTLWISVASQEDKLLVHVADDGRAQAQAPGAGGHGLIGMRERVTALGGVLTFGKSPDGVGWSVRVRLPIESTMAPRLLAETEP